MPTSSEHSVESENSGLWEKSRYARDFSEIKLLGEGGYGKVFLCKHNIDDQIYAVKQIPFNGDDREVVLREVRVLSTLYHEHVVRYHQAWIEKVVRPDSEEDAASSDSGASEDRKYCLFIQMEYCPKKLVDVLEQGIDADIAWKYFAQIVDGVYYLHENDVMHRDLTAQNILLNDSLSIKISDFGLARKCKAQAGTPKTSAEKLGNPVYRAPEMEEEDSKIDFKVDIFSLGMILFELLYHFQTGSERAKVLCELKSRGQFPECYINDNHKQFILRLLSKDPTDRPGAETILQDRFWDVSFLDY